MKSDSINDSFRSPPQTNNDSYVHSGLKCLTE